MIMETVPSSSGSLGVNREGLGRQLKQFLAGVSGGVARGGTPSGPVNVRLSQTALHLLANLPAARDAVFEYFGLVLDGIVGRYQPMADRDQVKEFNQSQEDEDQVIEQLQEVLTGFLESNPVNWAPQISKWSLDNLGKMSSKWSGKICGKAVNSMLLHEKLSTWLSCPAARCLLELSADCLSRLIDRDTESCVSALLETSVRHTPHFDWVVAHLGSCFPRTIVRRVLSVGLKDFYSQQADIGGDTVNIVKVPKLLSVVNILTHLSVTHKTELQTALHSVLTTCLTSANTSQLDLATVPFLIQLASYSIGIRRSISIDLVKILEPLIDKLATMSPSLVTSGYFASKESLLTTITHLLLSTDRGGADILFLLLRTGGTRKGQVSTTCQTLTHLLLSDLFTQVHSRQQEVAILSSISDHMETFFSMLLREDCMFQVKAVTQLIALYSIYKGRSVSAGIAKQLLLSSTANDQQLAVMTELLIQLEQFHPDMVIEGVKQAVRSRDGDQKVLLANLTSLVQQEQEGSNREQFKSSFVGAVRENQLLLAEVMGKRRDLINQVLIIFSLVPPDANMRVATLHRLCHIFVQVVYSTITDSAITDINRTKCLAQCETIMTELCRQQTGLQILLRFLLEAAINSDYSVYLGGEVDQETSETNVRRRQAASLFKDNLKFGSMPVQPLGSTTVFHAGTIGQGALAPQSSSPVDKDMAEINRRTISGIIIRLCEGMTGPPGEGTKQLALMMVEIISPDIMYNGLPWPEEDFMKVTIERDLSISRLLSLHPITWTLLGLLARARPALCYCSVIIRAVMAVSISHWQSHVTSRLVNHPHQLENTRRVLNLMAVGQFLPPQLALVPQILHIFDPAQLHCVLIDIWNFMKINVPGPNLFLVSQDGTGNMEVATRNFGPYKNHHLYCERLRVVMVSKIDSMAILFKKYFVDALQEGETVVNTENGHHNDEKLI